MTNAHFNYTDKLFNFNVSGSTGECDGNFRVTWDGAAQQGPYNFSVIPLDGSYQPFIVPVDSSLQYYDWKVNMSAGTYFTVMFKWVPVFPCFLWTFRSKQALISLQQPRGLGRRRGRTLPSNDGQESRLRHSSPRIESVYPSFRRVCAELARLTGYPLFHK
jgi:hypothetical protein